MKYTKTFTVYILLYSIDALTDILPKVYWLKYDYFVFFVSLSRLTHWKQTLFMMDFPVTVQQGDTIEGVLTMTRNKEWRRHLRVDIQYSLHINQKPTNPGKNHHTPILPVNQAAQVNQEG